MNADEPRPALEVLAGEPDADELAALVTVLAMLRRERGRPHAPTDTRIAGGWVSRWHLVRHDVLAGASAWRSTFRR
ncbi:acyl-CoA carboxylase subunit epsilon [Propioniciclava sp.]|uniref:acyl-CoA carboxylase subunit epsilon n=1 Tax=Propioniciclava sp. TaxID=2038686 RepID=UPI002619ED39|nr:acyl-CoA carboxylase subunit epsilon [Propioniciclava sp.]